MSKPSQLPEWDVTQANSIEPDATHKLEGWLSPGGVPEKPPFQTFNYWQNEVYRWVNFFDEATTPIENIADLRAILFTPEDDQIIPVLGYINKTENRDWRYRWNPLSTATDNGGTVIKVASITTGRFEFIFDGFTYNVSVFGARAGIDSYTAIQATHDAMPIGGVWEFEAFVNYDTTQEIIATKNCTVKGNGATITPTFVGQAISFNGTLKDTVSVTVDYTKGDYILTVDDVTNIIEGDLLNVVSTDLYNTSRTVYFLGGNVIAGLVDGLDITLSMAFPFDLTAANLTVGVYTPITVDIDNLIIERATVPVASTTGLVISRGKDCKISRIKTDNFDINIMINRCYSTLIENVETGHAFYAGSGQSYGLVILSSSFITTVNSIFNSGRHGSSAGGQEVNFGLSYMDCSIQNETGTGNLSLDLHGNTYDASFINCKTFGFQVSGNVNFKHCEFNQTDASSPNLLGVSEDQTRANYKFDQCVFNKSTRMSLNGNFQVATLTRKYLGNIIVKDCRTNDFALRIDLALVDSYGSPIVAEIDKVIIDNTDNVLITDFKDNINEIIMKDGNFPFAISTTVIIDQTSGHLNSLTMKNTEIPSRFRTINLIDFDKVLLRDCEFIDVSAVNRGVRFDDTNGIVNIENTDMSGFDEGFEVASSLAELFLSNSPIVYETGSAANIALVKTVDITTVP